MKTYLDCIPCFFRQALETTRIFKAGKNMQKKIMLELAGMINEISLEATPPEMAGQVHKMIKENMGIVDPYKKIKEKSNHLAMGIYHELINKIEESSDKLLMAVKLAIAGNIIDYGAKNSLDVEKELGKILTRDLSKMKKQLFNYTAFRKKIKTSKSILYIGDNAGEIVFDKLLIKEIKRIDPGKKIYFSVRGKPIINDALREDADFCSLEEDAEIIDSGAAIPGTLLSLCSKQFQTIFQQADMIISKGQGNYETLSENKKKIFFLLIAKCPIIARHIQCELLDFILIHNH